MMPGVKLGVADIWRNMPAISRYTETISLPLVDSIIRGVLNGAKYIR
jgi:hypothetical protein